MSTITLTESVKSPTRSKSGRWLVTCAVPGQGSSGFYSESLLREQGPAALPPGSQSFIDHGPGRNPKDLIGVFEEGGFWCEETNTLKAELKVFSHWEAFVSEVAPHVGMSLYMAGEVDDEGNVIALNPSPHNGVDLVSRPGLAGSGLDEQVVESLLSEALANAKAEENTVTVEEKVDALASKLDQFIASQQEKVKEEDEVTPEQLVAEALNAYQEAIAEIDKAELLPSQVEDLRERAKKGEEVTPLIESAKKINAELKAQFEEAAKSDSGVGNVRTLQVEDARELGKVFG